MAVTLNLPKRISFKAGYHFASSRRMAFVSASTGPAPSALVVVTVEFSTDRVMNAWTNLVPASSDSSKTRQLVMLNRLGKVLSTFMQARQKDTSLAVKPPPSIIGKLA